MSARKRRPARSQSRPTAQRRGHRFAAGIKKLAGVLLLAAGLALAIHLIYLNHLINQRFDGEVWAKPSRVYARALDLYAGLKITPEQFERELQLAGYRPTQDLSAEGQYRRQGKRIDYFNRAFRFSDELQDAARVGVVFRDAELGSITNLDNRQPIEFMRLSPALIGSYLPGNGENRLVLDAHEVPANLREVLLAVEDRQFERHFGINPKSIMRALIANIRAGRTVQGGSTLTQQLARNLFLTREKSLLRKVNEAILALLMELRFDKQALLTAYVNEVFLLQHRNTSVHGFALASDLLYRKPLTELQLDEIALLVGMVKGPTIYNPILYPQKALERRNQVLDILLDTGLIGSAEHARLRKKNLDVVEKLPPVNRYPAYLDLVRKQLQNAYSSSDLERKGLNIFTAFNPTRQLQVEQGLAQGLKRFEDTEIQAGVVLADYLNGDILALVGDREPGFPGFNRAIAAQRPLGSLIKPLLLYSLIESGHTLASLVEDRPIRIRQSDGEVWMPRNFDNKLRGQMTLYRAFVHSYNLPFVRLGVEQGALQTLVGNLERIHLQKLSTVYPSLLLGSMPMTPLEVAQMFQVIANAGYFAPLTTIREVMDSRGEVLSRVPVDSKALFDRSAMLQVIRAMIGVAERGTARYLKTRFAQRTYAGKTGTTNDLRDSWFAGFGNRHLGVVWLGKDDNQPVGLTGSAGALRVWSDIVDKAQEPTLSLAPDPNLEWRYVDTQTGGISQQECENTELLPFSSGQIPDKKAACRGNYLKRGIDWLEQHFQH